MARRWIGGDGTQGISSSWCSYYSGMEARHGSVPHLCNPELWRLRQEELLQVVAIITHFQKVLWDVLPGDLESSLVAAMQP